jgi:mannan endo-1,4-beta-mannosidase
MRWVQTFADIASTGATTVRTWGFNEVTAESASGNYYQLWSGTTATVNTGSMGFGSFGAGLRPDVRCVRRADCEGTDSVVAAAKAHGLRLIVTLCVPTHTFCFVL